MRRDAPNRRVFSNQFQSTHPLRGATGTIQSRIGGTNISIHAPLAGCDHKNAPGTSGTRNFNPRTPCGVRQKIFDAWRFKRDFNPRTPCGVRLVRLQYRVAELEISIHAPLAGCDCFRPCLAAAPPDFNLRTPCGVRRVHGQLLINANLISIYAPLAGCDSHERRAISSS